MQCLNVRESKYTLGVGMLWFTAYKMDLFNG